MSDENARPLILAASERLARALREDLNLREREAGLSVWRAPDVRSLRQWIGDVWADSWPSAQLLSDTQMQALWLDAVEQDRHGVISATACAREAHEAERLAQQYRIDLDDDPAYSEEQRAWRDWRRVVARRMRDNDWLSSEHLPAIVADALTGGGIAAPAQVYLAGFDATLTPALRSVLDALRATTAVDDYPLAAAESGRAEAWLALDGEHQIRVIAAQLRQRLAAARDQALPPRIVIALPDADSRRAALEDALIEQLAPGLRRLVGDDASRPRAPWRWDSATALGDSALAASLSAVTDLDATDNPPEAASRLLLGAWSADPDRHAQAAALDLALRQAGSLRISLRQLVRLAEGSLRTPLTQLAGIIEAAPRRALPSVWSVHFSARLEAVGWPGPSALSSAAFQQLQELRRALGALAALDAQTGSIDTGRARLWLRELLKRRFEPRAEHMQPVRIVDAADAGGIPCDLLIVADCDAGAFPGAAHGSPFLPIERQRAAGVPQASPAAWLAHRRIEIAALLIAAREVILVAPKIDARGGELTPSPLFAVEWTDAPESIPASLAERLAATGPHAVLPADDPVPPVAAPEAPRGNSGLFARFVQAPFFSLCVDRLGIEALPEVARGLPASLQGTLVHALLAEIWNRLGDLAALRVLTAAQRAKLIEQTLAPLLRRYLPAAEFGRALVQLEAARLSDVIGAWLAFEAAREDSFRVIAHERKLEGAIAGLPVSLRIDRIEAAADNQALTLVDYKTGAQVDPKGWRDDALSAPQLPLYAVLFGADDGAPVDDIAFAQVADGAPQFLRWQAWSRGLRGKSALPNAGDFAAQRQAWRAALATMAAEFLAGRADIDPLAAARMRDQPLLALAGLLSDDDEPDAGNSGAGT